MEYFTTGFLVEAERAQSRILEFLSTQQKLSGVSLTDTQRTILKITANKGTTAMADYLEKLKMSQKGVYKALQKLIELELLEQFGERKGSLYTITGKGLNYAMSPTLFNNASWRSLLLPSRKRSKRRLLATCLSKPRRV